MKLIKINNNLFDVFFNDGWDSIARFRKDGKRLIVYARKGKVPNNVVQLVETKLLMDKGV